MHALSKLLIPALATVGLLAGCGSSSKSSSSTSGAASAPATAPASSGPSSAIVKTASNSKLGRSILTDANGMTLYSLSGEAGGKFICTSTACTQVWHPLTGSIASASVGSLATVKRPDGTEQVAYKGMPLYTFAQDRAPGEANGQGIKDVGTWSAATVSTSSSSSGSAAAPATTHTETTAPESSGGGKGYGY
jgi:predicted lipoprotein with Yx(FWY)xxD motif